MTGDEALLHVNIQQEIKNKNIKRKPQK